MSNPLDRAVVFACDFRPRVVGGVSVMPNHGRASGAPAWLTLGDGTTATTFPTPLAGWGASFDGGDYVDTGVIGRYRKTTPFSLYFYGLLNRPGTGAATAGQIISSWNFAAGKGGIALDSNSNANTILWLINRGGVSRTFTLSGQTSRRFSQSIVANYGGSAAAILRSGVASAMTLVDTIGSNDIDSPISIKLGCIGDANIQFILGTGYAFGVFDGLLTPRDIQILDTLVRGNIR